MADDRSALSALAQLAARYRGVSNIPQGDLSAIGLNTNSAKALINRYPGAIGLTTQDRAWLNSAGGTAPDLVSRMNSASIPNTLNGINSRGTTGGGGGYFGDTGRGLDSWDRNSLPRDLQDEDKANRARIPAPSPDPGPQAPGLPDIGAIYNAIAQGYQQPSFIPFPDAPQANFKLNDFTDKANEMAAKAYSPQYAAIDKAIQNINTNYNMSKQITQGLYDRLLSQGQQLGTDVADRYAQATADSQQRGQQLQSDIGTTYERSQNQLADLLTRLGAGPEAAGAILPTGASDQAWNQSQALQSTNSFNNYLSGQGNAMQDFVGGTNQANQTRGVAAQEDLLRNKNNSVNNWDVQRLNLSGQQAQQALNLAQQLTSQDFGLQQANFGAANDYYNNMANQITARNNFNQQSASGLSAAQEAAANLAFKQYGLQNDQYNSDRDYALKVQQELNNNTNDMANLRLKEQQLGGQAPSDPFGAWQFNTEQYAGAQTGDYLGLVSDVARAPGRSYGTEGDFVRVVIDTARNKGLDPNKAARAASDWFNTFGKAYGFGPAR